jgi:hypothetical protein
MFKMGTDHPSTFLGMFCHTKNWSCFVQGTDHPGEGSTRGRFVQGTDHPGDSLSWGHIVTKIEGTCLYGDGSFGMDRQVLQKDALNPILIFPSNVF